MIYVMSEKFFKKNVEKLVKNHDYFGLDGANYAVTAGTTAKEAVASKYNRFYTAVGFCPEIRLYRYLRKKKDGDAINELKYAKELKDYLKDKSFIASVRSAFIAEIAKYPNTLNIFIVIPNLVWKYLGDEIAERIRHYGKFDFDNVFTQDDIKEKGFKILQNELSENQMKEIQKRVKKLESKYDLKFIGDDDD